VKRFSHTIEIAASPEDVWETLVDLEGWSEWNMLDARAPDGIAVGKTLKLGIKLGNARMPARATLSEVSPGIALTWRGGIPGVFHAIHGFDLSSAEEGCKVIHHEIFRGAMVGVALRALGPDPASRYRIVNEGLKRVVESANG